MKQFAFTIQLKDNQEAVETYCRYHQSVWPEVERDLAGVGVRRMRTYRIGERLMTVIDADDSFVPDDLNHYATCERTRQWDKIMNALQCPVPEAKPGEWWAEMELVYDNLWNMDR